MKTTPYAGQNDTVLNHLRRHGSITPLQAFGLYSIYRLAAVVHRLRNAGHDITTRNKRDPRGTQYAEYRMLSDIERRRIARPMTRRAAHAA